MDSGSKKVRPRALSTFNNTVVEYWIESEEALPASLNLKIILVGKQLIPPKVEQTSPLFRQQIIIFSNMSRSRLK